MKARYASIDFLRAISILGVIAIHVLSYNLQTGLINFLWNYLHFVIVAFVFCSGFVMYAIYKNAVWDFFVLFRWIKKRSLRLLLPFYIYLVIHYALVFLFPNFFSGLGLEKSFSFFLQTIFLIGGLSLNWLPLLFIQLTLLFPFLLYTYQHKKIFFNGYIILSVLFTLFITLFPFPYNYFRLIMWIPWSLFFILPWYFYGKSQQLIKKLAGFIAVFSFALYIGLFFLWSKIGRPLNIIDNKYPPNLFCLSYETFGTMVVFLSAHAPIFTFSWIKQLYTWISENSYALYFIHFIFLDFILHIQSYYHVHLLVFVQVVLITGGSIFCAFLLKHLSIITKSIR